MIGKGSKLYSILRLKCPACHEGNLFTTGNPFNLRRMLEMPDKCGVCGQDFNIEAGFYSGAPYMSYPFVILMAVPIVLVQTLYFDISFVTAFVVALIIMLLLQPIIMRFARAMWINFFVAYRQQKKP